MEKLQVSLVCDASGAQVRRSVEGLGGNLRISVSKDEESSDSKLNLAEILYLFSTPTLLLHLFSLSFFLIVGKPMEQKRQHKRVRKGKRNRVLSSTSTGTTGTTEEDDESWEDLSSEEEAVSILTDLEKIPRSDMAKCIDVSSGPESLDPVPAPGKEDEFLWDDFHPAGFQDNDNVTLHLTAEAAYQALLDEKAKQVAAAEGCEGSEVSTSSQPPQVSFRLDTACLEDSSDELEGAKLDPLLVTTQIVQAEVDCMSLTSLPTDTSITEEVSQLIKTIREEDGKQISKVKKEISSEVAVKTTHENVCAEELSGPVSILDVHLKEMLTTELSADNLKGEEGGLVVSESKVTSSSEVAAEVKLKTEEHKKEPEKKVDLEQESDKNTDLQQELEEREYPKKESEKKDVQEPIQNVPANIESSKESTKNLGTQQTTILDGDGSVTKDTPQKENVSEKISDALTDIRKNGDASGISSKSSTISDEKPLSAQEATEVSSDDGVVSEGTESNSMNSSENVTTDKEHDIFQTVKNT